MAWIWSWWYGGKQTVPPALAADPLPVVSVDDTYDAIGNLDVKRQQLEKKARDEKDLAHALHQQGHTTEALMHLKRSKVYESQAANLGGMGNNMRTLAMNMDAAAATADVARIMKSGTVQMQSLVKQVNINEVDGIADDLDDAMAEVSEMSSALSRPIGVNSNMMDEDELLVELGMTTPVSVNNGPNGGQRVAVPKDDNPIILPSVPVGKVIPIKSKQRLDVHME